MKKLKLFLFIAVISLASCSKDEDGKNGSEIVGTWRLAHFSFEEIETIETNGQTYTTTYSGVATQTNGLHFIFHPDGTAATNGKSMILEITTTEPSGETYTEEIQTESDTSLGTYKINGDTIIFRESNEIVQQMVIVELSGTKLHLKESSTESSDNMEIITTTDMQFTKI